MFAANAVAAKVLTSKCWQPGSMDIQQDYFAFLGLPAAYDLDVRELTSRFRELQKQLHPDRHAHLSEREQRMSVQYTAYLNEAYSTLKSPLLRAQYLLKKRGVDTTNESSVKLDPMFLFEQMELRESLEQAKVAADVEDQLETMADSVESQLALLEKQFSACIVSESDSALAEAEVVIRKMQFAVKLQKEIEQAENELDL